MACHVAHGRESFERVRVNRGYRQGTRANRFPSPSTAIDTSIIVVPVSPACPCRGGSSSCGCRNSRVRIDSYVRDRSTWRYHTNSE